MSPIVLSIHSQSQSAASLLDDPVSLVALGVGAAMLLYFLVLRRGARSARPADRPLATPRLEVEAEREIRLLLDELERMAEVMTTRFEAREQRLERLIQEADRRAAALEAGLARASSASLAARAMSAAADEGHDCGLAALTRHREIYELADAGEGAPAIAQKLRRPAGEVELILALRGTGGIS